MKRYDPASNGPKNFLLFLLKSCVALLSKNICDASRKRTKMQTKIVPSVVTENLSKSHCTVRGTGVTETEVRDLIVTVDGMLGLAAAQNPMHTKQTGAKQSQIGKRTTAKQM